MDRWLYVDDLRTPDYRSQFVARSFKQAISYLRIIKFDVIDLDYYLGDGTGMDILKFMNNNNISCRRILIHSDYFDGRIKMRNYINKYMPDIEAILV